MQPGAALDFIQQCFVVRAFLRRRFAYPHPVNINMQHTEPVRFHQLLGLQQHLAAVGGDGFVGLDAAEAGVLVSQVAEAGHQQPLVGGVAAPVGLALRVVCRQ